MGFMYKYSTKCNSQQIAISSLLTFNLQIKTKKEKVTKGRMYYIVVNLTLNATHS